MSVKAKRAGKKPDVAERQTVCNNVGCWCHGRKSMALADRLAGAVEDQLFVRAVRCSGYAFPAHARHPLVTRWHGGDRAVIRKAILAAIREVLSEGQR